MIRIDSSPTYDLLTRHLNAKGQKRVGSAAVNCWRLFSYRPRGLLVTSGRLVLNVGGQGKLRRAFNVTLKVL